MTLCGPIVKAVITNLRGSDTACYTRGCCGIRLLCPLYSGCGRTLGLRMRGIAWQPWWVYYLFFFCFCYFSAVYILL